MRFLKILLIYVACLCGFANPVYSQAGVAKKVAKGLTKSTARHAERKIAEKMAAKGFKRKSMNFADRAVGEQFIKRAAREKVCELMEKQGTKSFLAYGNHMAAKEIRRTGVSASKRSMISLSRKNGYRARMMGYRKEARINKVQRNSETKISKIKGIPKSHGSWTGEPGNSVWKPDPDFIPMKNQYSNPQKLTWRQIMKKYGIEGIPFKNGVPDFKAAGLAKAEVKFEDIGIFLKGGTNRKDLHEEAFKRLAKQRNCTVEDVKKYKEKNNLVWHEDIDCKTLLLVPREVHDNIVHVGGVSVANKIC